MSSLDPMPALGVTACAPADRARGVMEVMAEVWQTHAMPTGPAVQALHPPPESTGSQVRPGGAAADWVADAQHLLAPSPPSRPDDARALPPRDDSARAAPSAPAGRSPQGQVAPETERAATVPRADGLQPHPASAGVAAPPPPGGDVPGPQAATLVPSAAWPNPGVSGAVVSGLAVSEAALRPEVHPGVRHGLAVGATPRPPVVSVEGVVNSLVAQGSQGRAVRSALSGVEGLAYWEAWLQAVQAHGVLRDELSVPDEPTDRRTGPDEEASGEAPEDDAQQEPVRARSDSGRKGWTFNTLKALLEAARLQDVLAQLQQGRRVLMVMPLCPSGTGQGMSPLGHGRALGVLRRACLLQQPQPGGRGCVSEFAARWWWPAQEEALTQAWQHWRVHREQSAAGGMQLKVSRTGVVRPSAPGGLQLRLYVPGQAVVEDEPVRGQCIEVLDARRLWHRLGRQWSLSVVRAPWEGDDAGSTKAGRQAGGSRDGG